MRGFAVRIAVRYLLTKKKAFISFITSMAVIGVAIGVAALTTIVGASSGLQTTITEKVVGFNSHVLVMTGGWEFDRYEDVGAIARSIPGVVGAAPFVINERMILKGSRTHGVLVKGVDPASSSGVLDAGRQITRGDGSAGSLRDLRPSPGAEDRVRSRRERTKGVDDLPGAWFGPQKDGAAARAPVGDLPPAGEVSPEGLTGAAVPPGSDGSSQAGPALDPTLDETVATLRRMQPAAAPRAGRAEDLFHPEAFRPDLFDEPGDSAADDLDGVLQAAVEEAVRDPSAATALPTIVLGRTLAEKLDARPGDVVRIVSPAGGFGFGAGEGGPTDVSFEVAGLFYSGFNEYDSRAVFIHLREAQEMFQRGDTVTGVELRLDDIDRAGEVADDLRALLAAYDTVEGLQGVRGGLLRTGGSWERFPDRRWLPRRAAAVATLPATLLADATHESSYRVITWRELNRNLFAALFIQKIVLVIVLAVVVGVAAFNIVSTLILIVLEKKKEIAILKSMGALDADVRTVFLVLGVAIGVAGLAIGVGLGIGLSALLRAYGWPLDPKVYMIDHLPIDMRAVDYAVCAGIAFAICLVATLIPSWRAAKMRPVEGLHYE